MRHMLSVVNVQKLRNVTGKFTATVYQLNGVYSVLVSENKLYSMADQFGIEVMNGLNTKREAIKIRNEVVDQIRDEGINIHEECVRLGLSN